MCLVFFRAADSLPLASEAEGEARLRLGFVLPARLAGVLVPLVEDADSFFGLVSSVSFLASLRAVEESEED